MSFHKGILGQSTGGASVKEKTLGDYINRIIRSQALDDVANERKLTFEEWFDIQVKKTGFADPWQNSYDAAKDAWKAAQENK